MSNQSKVSVSCGSVDNSFEELKLLSEQEAAKLATTLEVSQNESVSVAFWTKDIPELIGIGKFQKNQNGSIVYEIDYSQATL